MGKIGAMENTLRSALLLCLLISWMAGLSAWATDFDTLPLADTPSLITDPLFAPDDGDCPTPGDHCEHGMAHWVGLPAMPVDSQPSLVFLRPFAVPQRPYSSTLSPDPHPPRG